MGGVLAVGPLCAAPLVVAPGRLLLALVGLCGLMLLLWELLGFRLSAISLSVLAKVGITDL